MQKKKRKKKALGMNEELKYFQESVIFKTEKLC